MKLIWSLFIASTVGIILCFAYQFFFIHTPDLTAATDTPTLQIYLKSYSWILAILYGMFGFLLLKLPLQKPKHVLILILAASFVCIAFAVLTLPTTSQDLYWNLLIAKISVAEHLDPYSITPNMFPHHPWHPPVKWWGNVSMIYGPLWTLFVQFISFPAHLSSAAWIAKSIFAVVLIASGAVLWKIFGLYKWSLEKKVRLFGLFALNPALITFAVVDGHNDIFLLFLILVSYLFILQKRYYLSITALIVACFIKYTPALLLMVPLWHLFFETKLDRKEFINRIAGVIFIAVISCLAFLPWILDSRILHAVGQEYIERGTESTYQYAPGGLIIRDLLFVSPVTIKFISLLIGIFAIIILTIKKKFVHAYTAPFALLFFFVPWFQPWYFLWILPLCLIAWSPGFFIVTSLTLILVTPIVGPIILLIPFGYALSTYLPR